MALEQLTNGLARTIFVRPQLIYLNELLLPRICHNSDWTSIGPSPSWRGQFAFRS